MPLIATVILAGDASTRTVVIAAIILGAIILVVGLLILSSMPEAPLMGPDKQTIDKLDRLSGRFALLNKSGFVATTALTSIGVAVGIVASASADWILKGPGVWFFKWHWNSDAVLRGVQTAALALILANVLAFMSGPLIKRLVDRNLEGLKADIDAWDKLLDRLTAKVDQEREGG